MKYTLNQMKHRNWPVSYTHLDVYKRQTKKGKGSSNDDKDAKQDKKEDKDNK